MQKEKREEEMKEILGNAEAEIENQKTGWLGNLLLSSNILFPIIDKTNAFYFLVTSLFFGDLQTINQEDLKKRLHEKIQEIRSKRKAGDDGNQTVKKRKVEANKNDNSKEKQKKNKKVIKEEKEEESIDESMSSDDAKDEDEESVNFN